MKRCTKCKRLKEAHKFNNNKNTKDGLQYWCKLCMNNDVRECFACDEDGHWYQIPLSKKELFYELLYNEENETKFMDEFGILRLNMHISNYSFIDCQEI